ncbi:hypothetical protein OG612_45205 (plasmid) [Streptomyces sp. NBC_01527]|uniref:hypothetical protein n=1 Tax=Streptomyces sp. NBC_01527 TaxID=2903894 RepID=UPI002F908FB3
MEIRITSFWNIHGPAPEGAHITLDLREHFRDPRWDPRIRDLTARHAKVVRLELLDPSLARPVSEPDNLPPGRPRMAG